jgi:type I restriction-modification system DNA methylase subunit
MFKSTWFASEDRREFARALDEADPRQRIDTLFGSFLYVISGVFRQAANARWSGSIDEEMEQLIVREHKQWKNPSAFYKAIRILTESLEERSYDFLGSFYQEIESNYRPAGQFFTPQPVCDMMARMQMHDLEPRDDHRPLTINDPACGAGAMLIAAVNVLRENGVSNSDFCIYAQDVDIRCAQMAHIQLTLLDAPSAISHMNTLSMETFDSWWNEPAMRHHVWRRWVWEDRVDFPEAKPVDETKATESDESEMDLLEFVLGDLQENPDIQFVQKEMFDGVATNSEK